MRHHQSFEQAVADHLAALDETLNAALSAWERGGGGAEGVVFDAGRAQRYVRDDQDMPFRACPHLARYVPDPGPDDLVLARPGSTPHWVRVVPKDYWHEPRGLPHHPVIERIVVTEVPSREAADAELRSLTDLRRCAYIGPDPIRADRLGILPEQSEPRPLLAQLDWARSEKTTYEVGCIREALRDAARGHAAVASSAAERPSEYQLHMTYLGAAKLLDAETPYPGIVAWDDRAGVLHYQTRRRTEPDPGSALLIDAGASAWGYACDVTRTYVDDSFAPLVELYRGMQLLQSELADGALPGQSFVALHTRALVGIAELLSRIGVLMGSTDEALEKGWIDHFMPHGLGHMLGLRVHDVGGHQVSPDGETKQPPEAWPYLRLTRELRPGNVVTIEPGIYFMPTQLSALRSSARGAFDWGLLRQLEEFGGIRIEDDVWITDEGPVNLSRPLIP